MARSTLGLLLAALLLTGCARRPTAATTPQVRVDTGALRGARVDGVLAFRGIPYAAPPVGELRWRPPAPATPWPGVRDATDYGPMCAQPRSAMLWFELRNPGEDCLTLNVWTPTTAPAALLPVMVWIHGGGFSQGSGNLPRLNSTALPKQGVILVTINYRLAVFGFLAHPALARPGDPVGNFGLLDAVAALQWVQRNIAAFGGDPGRVTLFGESAGADAVNHLMVMPAAAGLFQQAISQSSSVGMAPAPRVDRRVGFNPPAAKVAEDFMARLDLPAGADPAEAMRALPADALLAAMTDRDRFPPVVDGVTLPDQVGRLFAAGRQQAVPYLTGSNSWEASLGRMIGGGFSPAVAAKLVPAADQARLYPDLDEEARNDAIFADLVIHSQSRFLAGQMARLGTPVYAYYLSYVAGDRRGRQPGAAHADDIAFVMQTLDVERDLARVTPADRAMSALLNGYWLAFARTGNPNGGDRPAWPRYAPPATPVLELGDTVAVRDDLLAERMAYHLQRGRALLQSMR